MPDDPRKSEGQAYRRSPEFTPAPVESESGGSQRERAPGELGIAGFPVAFRGYEREAVDLYVARTNRRLAELEATHSPEAAIRRALEQVGEETSGILQQAQETANDITSRARAKAEERLENAEREADSLRAEAEARVRELDGDTDRIWRERVRLLDDVRRVADELLGTAGRAEERYPAADTGEVEVDSGSTETTTRLDPVRAGPSEGASEDGASPPTPPTFDLQSHSVHSDGALPPREVVRLAAEAGVELLALSDHDTVEGVDEALAAGAEHGVRVVPAVELSSVHDRYEDLHVLGYGIDHHSPHLLERLAAFRGDRELRAERMAERLQGLGYEVDDAPLEARRKAGQTIGRPHLSEAVISHPANRERLEAEGLTEVNTFLPAYLIPGAPAFLPRTTPTVEEAIALIHEAGGVAVWAHPFWDIDQPDEVLSALDAFREWGLDGAEAFYVTHTREQTLLLADSCEELGLLATGSADFHGPEHKRFSRFRAFELHGREPRLGRVASAPVGDPGR